ncbi:hypothetical protein BC629DRAFT_1593889 [Irpex lacteus]|nr:hypothetical protein BC629DRAFT_1593889 [Irpex lacteus]
MPPKKGIVKSGNAGNSSKVAAKAPEPPKGEEKPLFPPGSKYPASLLHERCQKNGWDKPNIETRKQQGGFGFVVFLSRTNKKNERETVRLEPHPPYLMPTALEARHWGATYALYRFCNGIQLNRVLPPGPRDYWNQLAAEHKQAPEHQKWMYEADPFTARKVVDERQEKAAKKREEPPSGSRATVAATSPEYAQAPEVKMASSIRETVEESIKKAFELYPEAADDIPTALEERQISELHQKLGTLGFTAHQARSATEALSKPSGLSSSLLSSLNPLDACMEYLLLHVPECDLPKRFLPAVNTSNPFISSAHSGTADLKLRWLQDKAIKECGWPAHVVKDVLANSDIGYDWARLVKALNHKLMGDESILPPNETDLEAVDTDELEAFGGSFVDDYHMKLLLPVAPVQLHVHFPSTTHSLPLHGDPPAIPSVHIRLAHPGEPRFSASIIITQPRRLSAIGVAARVSAKGWTTVQLDIPFEEKVNKAPYQATLLYTGVVLRRLGGGDKLEDVTHVIVDEVHERSVDGDILLLQLKELMARHSTLSAALQAIATADRIDFELIAAVVRHIIASASEPSGILIFYQAFKISAPASNPYADKQCENIPLHANLSSDEQRVVFEPTPGWKIIAATNVAETSITIDDIVYVIDSGNFSQSDRSSRISAIDSALTTLTELGAITDEGELTPMGQHLATLPVDLRLGKMLIFGTIFRCLGPILTVAACLSSKPLFVSPMDKREEATRARERFATANSDLLTDVNAYEECRNLSSEKGGGRFNFVSQSTIRDVTSLRSDFLSTLVSLNLVPAGSTPTTPSLNMNSSNTGLLKAVILAGLWPRVARVVLPHGAIKFDRVQAGTVQRANEAREFKFYDIRVGGDQQGDGGGRVFLHPSSVLFRSAEWKVPFVAYFQKHMSSKVFLRDATEVPFYALLMFGGPIDVNHIGGGLTVGNKTTAYVKLKAWPRIGVLVKQLRQLLDVQLKRCVEEGGTLDFRADNPVVQAVLALLQGDGLSSG